MEFEVQHNGKGKSHLLNNSLDVICKSNAELNFTGQRTIVFKDRKFFENTNGYLQELNKDLLEAVYCKKCLKKIRSNDI